MNILVKIFLIILFSKNEFYAYDCTDKTNSISLYNENLIDY